MNIPLDGADGRRLDLAAPTVKRIGNDFATPQIRMSTVLATLMEHRHNKWLVPPRNVTVSQ